jgi:hypothetical protein
VLVRAIAAVTGLVKVPAPRRGLPRVNDRFLAALAALPLLAATPMVCAAAMASFLAATVTLSG